jgi:hypothetical protein
MLSALLLASLFGLPGLVLLGCARARGSVPWPWPRGVPVALAFGLALAGVAAIALGALGVYSLAAECVAVAAITAALVAAGGFRFAWPLGRAPLVESAGFVMVGAIASLVFLGHPFEMLLGERDATVYTVSGIGLAREGSLVLRDHTAERIGAEAMGRFYPPYSKRPRKPKRKRMFLPQVVKYPGFYYVDEGRSQIIAQGLPLLPATIAIFYGAFGLGGAFAATNFVGLVAVLSVFAAGSSLIGAIGATLGASLLALDLIEVWASGYPVAEILLQTLLFAGLAAYLRGDRLGRSLAGFLLGATLLVKVEAALLFAPLGVYAVVAAWRRRGIPGASFWASYGATAVVAAACWLAFQADYARNAYRVFASLQSRMLKNFSAKPGSATVAVLLVVTLLAMIGLSRRAASRRELSRPVARGLAVGVVLFVVFGYWVRPHLVGLVAGQGKTLIWLSWYVSPGLLLAGFAGLAHYLWTRAEAEGLFVLGILLTLSVVFLHFMFVNLIQIYMTRRFVPAALPMVLLFFGYAVATLGAAGTGRARVATWLAAALVSVAALHTIVVRSHHLYRHREYPGLAQRFADLAENLKGADLVFLSDGKARNLLGPALEFVFGVKTLVVWPPAYEKEKPLIHRWIDEGMAIGALTVDKPLEEVPGAEDFEPVDHEAWWISVLGQVEDRFPTQTSQDYLTLTRYAAGRGSDPLYDFWKRDGARVTAVVCGDGVRLLGGSRFLVRRVRAGCPGSGVAEQRMGYLVGDADSAVWQRTLEAYGARFVRRDLGGVVLFDEIAPQPAGVPLSPAGWTLEASDGRGSEGLAVDGRLDTRWGSHTPQRPGMRFAISFTEPTDVSWLKIRMGRFASDRARGLAVETSVDGTRWNRREMPSVVEGIRWKDGTPEESADGNIDLWVNAAGLRGVRLVNDGESSRFDWSIAELEIQGRPAR